MITTFNHLRSGGMLLVFTLWLTGCRHATPDVSAVDAAFDAHVQELQTRLPNPHFSIVVEPPFVLVGDVQPRELIRHAQRVVRPLVSHLRSTCFSADPDHIIDIWLFRNERSCRTHVRQLFGHDPVSHFGYVAAEHHALIVNIATGKGTLRHEVVHPFVAASLPECPPWFDEGLASLYERIEEEAAEMRGTPNWRLALLQEGIRKQDTLALAGLMRLTREQFYDDKLGLHYAQSRYLCLYLQEKGLLTAFCKAFVQAQEKDPTGHDTLCEILGLQDLEMFQPEWEAFVMTLSFH